MADTPKNNTSEAIAAKNEKLKADITAQFTEENYFLTGYIGKAKKNTPSVPGAVFDDIIAARQERLQGIIDDTYNILKFTPDGFQPPDNWSGPRLKAAMDKMNAEVKAEVLAKHRDRLKGVPKFDMLKDNEVEAAFQAIRREAPKAETGFFSGMADGIKDTASTVGKPIYNPEKGGMQTGGIMGLLAGLGLGALFSGGGGFMGVVSMIIFAIGEAMLGNKFIDNKEPVPSLPQPAATPVKTNAVLLSGPDVKLGEARSVSLKPEDYLRLPSQNVDNVQVSLVPPGTKVTLGRGS